MTTITNNLSAAPFSSPALSQALLGAEFVMAAGIFGKLLNPLGAGPRAFAQLPSMWTVLAQSLSAPPAAPPAAQWTASTGAEGRANIDLGDGYTLDLNENSSEIVVKNANTGETTRIWGDPHVDIDGAHAFDFWGTTTFTLENGTKITINTEEYAANPDMYLASQLTITKGDQAIVVKGISENKLGDLSITLGNDGKTLDAATRDGFVLTENASGSGWRSDITGQIATQKDLDLTRPGQFYGPGSTAPSVDELASTLTSFLLLGAFAGVVSSLSDEGSPRQPANAARALAFLSPFAF